MKVLLIGKLLTEEEWQTLVDTMWEDPSLFLNQDKYELKEIDIKKPLENFNIVSYSGEDYIVHRSYDLKGELQGYIFLNFQTSFMLKKDKELFCSGCTSNSIEWSDDLPLGELTSKQRKIIEGGGDTSYCSNCQRIVIVKSKQGKKIVVSPTRKRRLK